MAGNRVAERLMAGASAHPGWVTFVLTFAVFATTASWDYPVTWDAEAASVAAHQLSTSGTPWLEGLDLNPDNPWFVDVNGHVVSNRQIGVVLLAVPFYWVLQAAPAALWPATLAAVAASAGSAALMNLAVRAIAPAPVAWGAAGIMAFSTPMWTVSANALWPHSVTQLCIAAAAYFAARDRWWLVGMALGYGVMARPHLIVIAVSLALLVGLARKSVRITVAIGIPCALWIVALLGFNRWIFGSWTLTGYSDYARENLTSGVGGVPGALSYVVNWLGFFFAPDRGLFIWTPIALVLVPAAIRASRTAPDWVLALAAGGLLYTAIQLRVNVFQGGQGFYGYRHPLELFTSAIPLFALAWVVARRPTRAIAIGVAAFQICVIFIGAIFPRVWLPAERAWSDNAYLAVFRAAPFVLGPLTALMVAVAIWVGIRLSRGGPAEQAAPEDHSEAGGED